MRFSPEGKPLDVVAHGFRNPYDLDFDAAGHLLTVDSDGERDHHLPWYAPTRLFDVAQGMEHGWLLQGWTRGWNRPQSFFDSVERMVEIGRGSPTGVVAYRHHVFPLAYNRGVFSACWTLGRVYYFPLEPARSTCRSKLEIFLQTTGDVGFAPCDLAVGPEGDLFVAIGGRHTRGSVFRIRATGLDANPNIEPEADSLLDHVLARRSAAGQLVARPLGAGGAIVEQTGLPGGRARRAASGQRSRTCHRDSRRAVRRARSRHGQATGTLQRALGAGPHRLGPVARIGAQRSRQTRGRFSIGDRGAG